MKKILNMLCFAITTVVMPLSAQNVGGTSQQATAEQIGSFRAEMQKQLLIARRK